MAEVNRGAWLPTKQAYPFSIAESPMPEAKPHEVVIRVRAVAINPCDAAIQRIGIIVDHYPTVIGCDLAGTIVAIGAEAQKARESFGGAPLQVGDRVIAGSFDPHESRNAAFQLYTAAAATVVAKLPDTVSFADGSVLPLAFATAASCLFAEDQMALPAPEANPTPQKKVVLVWGAASSVGSCAVQLLKGAGFTVAATASEANLDFCKTLGADHVFDYKDPKVEENITSLLAGQDFAGAYDAIMAPETMFACGRIAQSLGRKVVGTVHPPFIPLPEGLPDDVKYTYSWGSFLKGDPWVVSTWGKWITPALSSGAMKCLPEKLVVGKGLENIQEAIDRYNKGISARKVVVEFD